MILKVYWLRIGLGMFQWEDMFLAAQMWSNGQMVSFGSLMSWKPLFYPAIQSPQEFVYAKLKGATFHLTFSSNKNIQSSSTNCPMFSTKKTFLFQVFRVVSNQGVFFGGLVSGVLDKSFSCFLLFRGAVVTLVQGTAIEKTYLKLIDFGLSKRFTPGSFASTKALSFPVDRVENGHSVALEKKADL